MSDPSLNHDSTEEWERELDKQKTPKLKFPIKATGENIEKCELTFQDPVIDEEKKKEQKKTSGSPKLVQLSKREKKKTEKRKLF